MPIIPIFTSFFIFFRVFISYLSVVLEFLDCLVHVHFLAVLESDDEGSLELGGYLTLGTQYLIIIGAFAVCVFVQPFFLVIAYRREPFELLALVAQFFIGGQNLYFENGFRL